MPRLCISGWKCRRALSLLILHDWPWVGLTALSQALTLSCVNLPFLLVQAGGNGAWGGVCLERDQLHEAEDIAAAMSRWWDWPPLEVIEEVAAITLYPLAGEMTLVAEALACLAGVDLRPLAFGTSLASLTVILPDSALGAAMEAFRRRFELPPESSPPEERVRVVQSPLKRGQ